MSHRTLISLAASAVIGVACVAAVSTDAFAYRRGVAVGHAGVYRGGVARGGVARAGVYRGGVYRNGGFYGGAPIARGVAVGVGAAAVGAAAAGAYGAYGAYADPAAPHYGYGYNGWEDYAARNGIVCRPGTWFKGDDGLQHLCQ
jgi:hypothetical protein